MSDEIPIKRKTEKKRHSLLDRIKTTKEFVEDTAINVVTAPKEIVDDVFYHKENTMPQKDYEESLRYIKEHNKSKVEFPVDSKSKEKISKMLSPEIVGSAGGLIGAAATVGLIGSTLGAGLIIAGAGALIGGVIAKNSKDLSWIEAEIVILEEEIVISGKFTLHFDEIKHVSIDNGLVVLTLKDDALAFRTYNAKALKTVISERMDKYYNNN